MRKIVIIAGIIISLMMCLMVFNESRTSEKCDVDLEFKRLFVDNLEFLSKYNIEQTDSISIQKYINAIRFLSINTNINSSAQVNWYLGYISNDDLLNDIDEWG